MIATGHQPCYWPWAGIFHKIASADAFILWDDVPMDASSTTSFENRNQVLTPAGVKWLTVPLRRHKDAKIKDLLIAGDPAWKRKHFKTIEQSYGKAPYWSHHLGFLVWVYEQPWERLVDLNEFILKYLLKCFDLTHVPIHKLSDLGVTASKSQAIADACKRIGAWKYIFGAHGKDYVEQSVFSDANVEPYIQEYSASPYSPQGNGRDVVVFTPNLSALDLIMNVEHHEAIEIMMRGGKIHQMNEVLGELWRCGWCSSNNNAAATVCRSCSRSKSDRPDVKGLR